MSDLTLNAPRKQSRSHRANGRGPKLIAPAADALVDAHMPTFEWVSSHDTIFVLEIARDAGFEDIVARVPTAESTSVTLHDVFRPDGERYFWRVRGDRSGAGESRPFIAAPYDAAAAAEDERNVSTRPAKAKNAVATQDQEPVPPPYLTGTTSMREAATVLLLLAISFIVMIGVIFGIMLSA